MPHSSVLWDEWESPPRTRSGLAEALLRFQRAHRTEADRGSALHASQSGEARTGRKAGAVGVEQLSFLSLRETGLVRMNFQEWQIKIKSRPVATFGDGKSAGLDLVRSGPLIRTERE